ncbi:NHLP bacteriocin system secretion protein [Stenomitos frigidus]|uniref:NHLP bacteriocin system secretion protein n=1 Tax=Stenomitos frigidus ULC18 TaxID=2107698 RepID=A0A2T1ECW0_9CYAN|nr:NHLP bacteriocin system secretion protein [Stenomitos frigidus]PSB30535.1 NHLP bacteriocin system secretion protein [Stenomitos frigidus ULC18]
MLDQKRELFRKEPLARLSSPEQLDQLMQVVGPKSWLPLAALGGLTFVAIVWSIVGRLPITVTGQGVLIRPQKVVLVQTPGAGQILTINVKAGDAVKQGETLATLDPDPELKKQLQQELSKLSELQDQDRQANALQGQRMEREGQSSTQQRQTLLKSLQNAQNLTPVLRNKDLESLRADRQSLQQRVQALQTLLPVLQDRVKKRQQIFEEGALSSEVVLQAQQEYLNNQATLADAQSQLKRLDTKEAEAERQYLSSLTNMSGISAQLRALDSQETGLAQQNLETTSSRQNRLQEVKRSIARLEVEIKEKSKILSGYTGRVEEIAVKPGQVIAAGSTIATLNAETPSDKLVSVTYFTVQDGKRIKAGMPVQVTPSTVKRERFGGVLGSVTSVSSLPATPQGALVLIGNEETVKNLMSGDRTIEVFTQLQEDPTTESGYKWSSSKGPAQKLSAATTTTVRVKVGEQSPISYIIPLLKSVTDS